jgi:hypothetical protein
MATAAELSRRGYDVAFTLGNTPKIDLLCSLPGGHAFKVQVKGVSHHSGPYVQTSFFKEPAEPMLFLVVVFVPPLGDELKPFRFFVLSHQQAIDAWKEMPEFHRDGITPYTEKDGDGLNWGSITPFEGKWGIFPHQDRTGHFADTLENTFRVIGMATPEEVEKLKKGKSGEV